MEIASHMSSIGPGQFLLNSAWRPEAGEGGCCRLVLTNCSDVELTAFRLGLSGPMRVTELSEIENGRLVRALSTYAEIAPPDGFVLPPGGTWTIEITRPHHPIRHWTDGPGSAFVIRDDDTTVPVRVVPLTCGGARNRRGTMYLPGSGAAMVSIIPWPNRISLADVRSAPPGLSVLDGNMRKAADAAGAFYDLAELLFPGEGLVRAEHQGGYRVQMELDPSLPPAAYGVVFESAGAVLRASGSAGFLYGLITLGQICRGAYREPHRFAFPSHGTIEDVPRLPFRGCHLDVARRFYSVAEIRRFLAVLAWNKLNVFHWHLSDDEAWRVEIAAYPQLTEDAAWRGHGLSLPPLLGSGPEKTGGYYTQADIRELVGLAQRFDIDVVPEIDVPGHSYALLQALPELNDPGETELYHSVQGFPRNCLNPANPQVDRMLETVLTEMFDLFPSRYFHLGADEVPPSAWVSSPIAASMAGKTAPMRQAEFMRRMQQFLSARGKAMGAWQEAAQGGGIDKKNCYLVGWIDPQSSQALADEGYAIVVAPGQTYYLDMANGPEFIEPGAAWAGWSSPEKTYTFDPTVGWTAEQKQKLLGVQACIWCEPMSDPAVFDRLVFPRLSAIAETAWTELANKSYPRFAAAAGLMPTLYGCTEECGQ